MGITAKDVMELRRRTDAPMMECKAALAEAGGDMDAAVKILRERGITKMAKRADRETAEGIVAVKVGDGNRRGTVVVVTCETDFTAKNEAFVALAEVVANAAAALGGESLTPEQVLEAKHKGKTVQEHLDDVKTSTRENMGLREVTRFPGVCGSYVHFDGKSGALVEVELGDEGKASSEELARVLRDVCMHVVAVQPPPLAVDASGIDPAVVEEERSFLIKQAMDSGKPREIAEKMVAGRMKKFYSERALLEQPFVKNPEQTISQVLGEGGKQIGTAITVVRFSRIQIGG